MWPDRAKDSPGPSQGEALSKPDPERRQEGGVRWGLGVASTEFWG